MRRLAQFKSCYRPAKASFYYFLLLAFAIGLSACAAPQELMVLIDRDRVEEAWENAYKEGMTLGYEREFHDRDKKIAEFNRKEVDQPLPMNLFIRMHLEETEEACVLWLTGRDKDIARDDDQVLYDMQRIVTKVERCCGEKDEAGKPVKYVPKPAQ
jgi:hypothetical protein